jgi:probable HAF family extracellular repeat protein
MPTVGDKPIGGTQGVAVSLDGKTIIGRALDSKGKENEAIWKGGTEWRLLGSIAPDAQPCDQLLSGAFGANDDGTVVVGLAWNGCKVARAFRWEESTGMVALPNVVTQGESTRANGVSGDGQVVVGWEEQPNGYRQGAKWVKGTPELIRNANGSFVGEAFAANLNGSIIIGTSCDPNNFTGPPTAWKWTPGSGLKCLATPRAPLIPNVPRQGLAQAVSEDGRVIGGSLSFGLEAESVVWFDDEPFLLKDYLRSHGVSDAFEGWVNTGFVTSVSPDGRILVGYGAGPRNFQGFMVVLPELPKQ